MSHTFKRKQSWTVWKLLLSYKSTLCYNMTQTRMVKDTKRRASTVKNLKFEEINDFSWKNGKNKLKVLKIVLETGTVTPIPHCLSTTTATTTKTTETVIQQIESRNLFSHLVGHMEEQTTPQKNAFLEPIEQIDRLPGTKETGKMNSSPAEITKAIQLKVLRLQPKIWTTNVTSSLENCNRQTGDQQNKTSTDARCCLAATSADQFNQYS